MFFFLPAIFSGEKTRQKVIAELHLCPVKLSLVTYCRFEHTRKFRVNLRKSYSPQGDGCTVFSSLCGILPFWNTNSTLGLMKQTEVRFEREKNGSFKKDKMKLNQQFPTSIAAIYQTAIAAVGQKH